jgi:arginyl-tRNA synthetase
MDETNPFLYVKKSILASLPQDIGVSPSDFEVPPKGFGDLSLPLHQYAKKSGRNPAEVSEALVRGFDTATSPFVQEARASAGYLNFYLKPKEVASLTWNTIRSMTKEYGRNSRGSEKVIVEHTSANPVHPLHIGAARNALLGDTLAKILNVAGKKVETRFYVDDTGKQTALVALASELLGEIQVKGKPDHWIGQLYVMINALFEVNEAKKKVGNNPDEKSMKEAQETLDEWLGILYEQSQKEPELFDELSRKFANLSDPAGRLASLIQEYEKGSAGAVKNVRKIVNLCLQGFRETLTRAGVNHDFFDYESDLLWEGRVESVLGALRKSQYVSYKNGAMVFDVDRAAVELGLKKILGIPGSHKIPEIVLTRSDGTSLYVTRDLAYSLKKLSMADRVYNVIGVEQSLAQLQLKVILYAIGYTDILKQHHLSYEAVELPATRMSGRRGRYVTLDSILDEASNRAYDEVRKRNPDLTDKEIRETAERIGTAAVRFALVSIGANKKITFTWERVLNFETNSAPYVLYTCARANSIIKKSAADPYALDPQFGSFGREEHEIVLHCARLPDTILASANSLRTETLAEYAVRLSDSFNSYYASRTVLGSRDEVRRDRLALVAMVSSALSSTLRALGIEPLERM